MSPELDALLVEILWLPILAVPVACVAWTVTHEEIFREARDYCARRSGDCQRLLSRKFFYVFTCEYCFSHWIGLLFILFSGYKLLLPDWRGYVISFFAVVWMANIYMSLFSRLRVDIRSERAEAEMKEVVANPEKAKERAA
jgi:hypothetical protein